jgi:hypothetical protein
MTTSNELGRLEKVDLRQIWQSEAGSFTPWLATEDNLNLLGETVGIDLELEAQEKGVGPFRADLLCKDTATGAWVLIENQLEKTDHTHLGQLLTYASGLQAVTIVWIAQRFTDEHRATLDWLNEITDDRFNFFGLEVELWKIGASSVAPKFNVVCKPNDWSKTISDTAKTIEAGELTAAKQLQLDYWAELRMRLEESGSNLKGTKALPQNWINFALGRSVFGLHDTVNTQKPFVSVGMGCYGPNAKAHFRILEELKPKIEEEIGEPLEWEELPHRKESRIRIRLDADPTTQPDWPRQHEWIRKRLEAFHKVFAPRVKTLDAEEESVSANEPA